MVCAIGVFEVSESTSARVEVDDVEQALLLEGHITKLPC
jgi:hypothetical protein